MLQDIATLTGAVVVSEERGFTLENTTPDMLGKAEKVTITKENTTIVGGAGNKEDIQDRVNLIRSQIEVATSEYDKEKLKERLGKLSGGVAVLYVGATTGNIPATDAAFSNATRATLVGSITPASYIFTNSEVRAL